MSFTSSAIPIGQQITTAATITQAESVLYLLVLKTITSRNLATNSDALYKAFAISDYLFALNDPNLSASNILKITTALNNIVTPYNSQVYPILNL